MKESKIITGYIYDGSPYEFCRADIENFEKNGWEVVSVQTTPPSTSFSFGVRPAVTVFLQRDRR